MGRNSLKLNTTGLEEIAANLDKLEADLKPIITKALEDAGKKVGEDTDSAMDKVNLPAKGKYSTGRTRWTIVKNPKTKWSGTVGEVGVGFDFSKPGAGGFLIGGTPKMQPNRALRKIYRSTPYMRGIEKDMIELFERELKKKLGG